MSPVTRRFAGGVSTLLLLASGSALAQEVQPPWAPEEPFTPSNEAIDRNLDQSLKSEFDERGEPIPDYAGGQGGAKKKDDEFSRVRLRLMGAYWRANIHNLELSHREGNSGGETIELNDRDNDEYDGDQLDDTNGGSYRIALDLGRFVTLSTSLRHARFKDENVISPSNGFASGFTYGDTTFNTGDLLGSRFEFWAADLDAEFNALNNDYVTLSVGIGLRYTRFETRLSRNGLMAEDETLESVVPTVSVGLAVRPVKPLELFAKARVGHLSYETEDHWRYDGDDDEWDFEDSVERESTTVEVDLGVSVTIAETVGFVVGYRFDHFAIERLTADRDQSVEGAAHGGYAGLLLQF